jgi:S1-C subfamily serine protease
MKLHKSFRTKWLTPLLAAGLLAAGVWAVLAVRAQDVDKRVLDDEAKRVAVIEKIKPAVVAVFMAGGQGGGSGVLIDKEGFALTNFHVVAGMMRQAAPVMQCGLPDGKYYDAVVVGLDKVGDVALIKLVKKDGKDFPFVPLGDSDKCKEGDWSLAMGNPFLLATDFNPTVTFGLISGVHRYQYPEGSLLEYTDCIQIDTSINPGNSGGPLFNMKGELIGINGRGSFDKRSRINSGVGYAISINQIKNFLGHLRAGIDTDHATLGAEVKSEKEEGDLGQLIVSNVLEENSDAGRRGLKADDILWKFDGRVLTSVNQFKNVLGIFPKGWRVSMVYRRENKDTEILVRLMGVQAKVIEDKPPQPQPGPRPGPRPGPVGPPSPAAKLFKAKKGYANYYFNEQEKNRLLAGFKKHGDFSKLGGSWVITADVRVGDNKTEDSAVFRISEEKGKNDKVGRVVVKATIGNADESLEPLKAGLNTADYKAPEGSGGLLLGLYLYQMLLTQGEKAFEGQFDHGGMEPFYPYPTDDSKPKTLRSLRVDAEVLKTRHAAFDAKWYFSPKDQTLLGAEVITGDNEDPCEIYFSDYKKVEGRMLPYRMVIRSGDSHYGTFTIKKYELGSK